MTPDALLVSVIVPTRNRPAQLCACLVAIAAQRFDRGRFEVVIVDDGGEVPLQPMVAEFSQQMRVRLVVQEHAGPARARNLGAAHASAALLAFTDDDCEPASDWLSSFHACFKAEPGCALGGITVNALPDNVYATASQLLIDYLYAYHFRAAATGRVLAAPPFFTSNNLAVPAVGFRDLGGFDESFLFAAGEDRDLCDRWQHRGYRLRTVPQAVIRHSHRLSLHRFWRQHINYGRGAFHLRRARLVQGRRPPKREPLGFYLGLILYPLGRVTSRKLRLAGLMALSQVATVLGFLLEGTKRPAR
jgi:GT2 family glycosyltransferase